LIPAQAQDRVNGFENLPRGNFRATLPTILVDNGDFTDLETFALSAKEHLEQKRVTVRKDGIQVNDIEYLALVASKAGRAIMGIQPQRNARSPIGGSTEHTPAQTTVPGSSAFDVT
jgi:hypothetical protein